jgi:hypothetical protein
MDAYEPDLGLGENFMQVGMKALAQMFSYALMAEYGSRHFAMHRGQ